MTKEFQQSLKAVLHGSYGLEVRELTTVIGGLDTDARSYVAAHQSGTCFVKVRPDLPPGVALSQRLRDYGISEVVAPLLTQDGGPAAAPSGGYVLVYPHLGAQNGFERPLSNSSWQRLGQCLRLVHGAGIPAAELPEESYTVKGVPQFKAYLDSQQPRFEGDEVLVSTLKAHREEVREVMGRVGDLGAELASRSWPLVPCHGDIHVGNVLTSDHRVYIVDWDTARLAPRECDLMFFLDGGIMIHPPEAAQSFLTGYGSMDVNLRLLAYCRYARAMEDVIAFVDDAFDAETAQESANWIEKLFLPGAVVDLAAKTLS